MIPLSSHYGSNCNWSLLRSNASHTCSSLAFVSLIILSNFIIINLVDMTLCDKTRLLVVSTTFLLYFLYALSHEMPWKEVKKWQLWMTELHQIQDKWFILPLTPLYSHLTHHLCVMEENWVKASKYETFIAQGFAPSAHPICTSPFFVNPTQDPLMTAPC